MTASVILGEKTKPPPAKTTFSHTFKGAEIYARIEGFISTARKNKRCDLSELCTTFEGHNFING